MFKVFISYKTGATTGHTALASSLEKLLEAHGYDVWRDKTDMVGGLDWNKQIYDQVRGRDVVVLVLTPETAASDWVRREVDVAKGALTSIVPVWVMGEGGFLDEALNKFDIPRAQCVDWREANDAQTEKLMVAVREAIKRTKNERQQWQSQLSGKVALAAKAKSKEYMVKGVPGSSAVRVYLAAGDITAMTGIDVIVNSENTQMQMGRYIDAPSLSAQLRLKGSYLNGSGQIIEDSVQSELYQQLTRADDYYTFPVSLAYVVPTHAGHKRSHLVKNKIRYIFHAATIDARPQGFGKQTMTSETDLQKTVCNCLDMVERVNEARGVISEENTPRYAGEVAAQDSYQPITSIIFPVFGTGHGGRNDYEAVVRAMARAIAEYVAENHSKPGFTLTEIYIGAFSNTDYTTAQNEMDSIFIPIG